MTLQSSHSVEYREVHKITINDDFDGLRKQRQNQLPPPSVLFDLVQLSLES